MKSLKNWALLFLLSFSYIQFQDIVFAGTNQELLKLRKQKLKMNLSLGLGS